MRNKFVTFTALALIGLTGAAVASDGVYYRQTASSFYLTSTPGTPQTVLSLTVPAGTWVITAKANPVDFSQPDFARCQIIVGSTQHDGAATFIGGSPSAAVAEIVLQTVVTTTSSKVVELQCQHDYNTPGIYIDPLASIVVVKAAAPIG